MNRPQYRLQWPPFSPSVIGLTIFFFLFWLLSVIVPSVGEIATAHFSVSLDAVKQNRIWTVFTYSMYHRSFFEVLFTGIALWLFGGELESFFGKKTWWGMLIGAAILGGLFVLVYDFALPSSTPAAVGVTGMHAGVMAFVTAYCIGHWNRSLNFFFVPLTGKTMLLFFLGLSVLMAVISGFYSRILLDVAGVIVGVVVAKRVLNFRDLRTRFALWRARRHLKVVRSPESKPNGKYTNGAYKNGIDKPN